MIHIDGTVAAGATRSEAYTIENQLRTNSGLFQYQLDGDATDVDLHVEARLSDSFGWTDWLAPRTGLSDGADEIVSVDLEDVPQLRLRIVNNDASNPVLVKAALKSGSE